MRSREEIFDIYIQEYNTFIRVRIIKNPTYIPDSNSVEESIEQTERTFKDQLPEIILSEKEKEIVSKKIKSINSIYQDEGQVILGDYDHDREWYNKLLLMDNYDEYYWKRYKNHLITNAHLPNPIIDRLENSTLKNLMSYLGNPNDDNVKFSIRGLVIGDVQSGKTSNYLGLISKATDAGYRIIFILTGTIEGLRKQTQSRVEEGFIGYDSVSGEDVGVGRGDKLPRAFTSRAKDFISGDDQNTSIKISDYLSEPMIFVIKKNVSVLKKVYSSIKRINTTRTHEKIDYPMLMIDDEADNASVNTNKLEDDPTKVNKYIRSILSLFTRSSYVGFTATPFANVFISYKNDDEMLKDDLFPRDFIYSLSAPSNYLGAKQYFFDNNENVRLIRDANDDIFPLTHKKIWDGNVLFNSAYHAINTFLIANVIRDLRDVNKNTHRTMLINMSRFTNVQEVIKGIVDDYFEVVKKNVKQTHRLDTQYALTNPTIASLKESFEKEYTKILINGSYVVWEQIFDSFYDSIKDIQVVVVNSSKNSSKLRYSEFHTTGLRAIVVGGLALSRGLTLEGLCTSYFYRNTATFDVLMQMGRWFGYREGYHDICKIFVTDKAAEYYREISESMDYLRRDIGIMGKLNKKPEEYGIRVRNDSLELGITAINKMRYTKMRTERKSYYGNVFETPYLHRDLDIIEHNIEATLNFLAHLNRTNRDHSVTQHPYFRSINKMNILELLRNVKIHEANTYFDTKQIMKFLQMGFEDLNYFDVLVIGGESTKKFKYEALQIEIPLVSRKFDMQDSIIRISGIRAHLMGRQDTKYGLNRRQEEQVYENPRVQDFLIKGRNPLIIIYFIDPKPAEEEHKLEDEFKSRKYNYLVGYSIGFPQKEGIMNTSTSYIVNSTVDYYNFDHDNDEEGEIDE